MPEIKTHRDHPASMAERIDKRLRNSGGEEADTIHKTGTGPQRVYSNLHNSGSARQHGSSNEGEPGVDGAKRGVVKTGDGR
jgi:hypothetical protein